MKQEKVFKQLYLRIVINMCVYIIKRGRQSCQSFGPIHFKLQLQQLSFIHTKNNECRSQITRKKVKLKEKVGGKTKCMGEKYKGYYYKSHISFSWCCWWWCLLIKHLLLILFSGLSFYIRNYLFTFYVILILEGTLFSLPISSLFISFLH